jgi:hypothetical protein
MNNKQKMKEQAKKQATNTKILKNKRFSHSK